MTPTLFVALITSGAARPLHLSLHTSYEGAVSAVLRAGGAAYREGFGYVPEDLRPLTGRAGAEYGFTHAAALRKAEDRLTGAGWHASVEEYDVDLDAAEEEPYQPQDDDAERAADAAEELDPRDLRNDTAWTGSTYGV